MRWNQVKDKVDLDLDSNMKPGDKIDITGRTGENNEMVVQITLVKLSRDAMDESVHPNVRPGWVPSTLGDCWPLVDQDELTQNYFLQVGPTAQWHDDVRVQKSLVEGEVFFTGSFWMYVTNAIFLR